MSYALEWRRGRSGDAPAGGPFEVTNDLGYVVRVARGYVVTRSIELVPCNPVPPPVSLRDSIDLLFRPQPAFAGHSAIADPSAIRNAIVESLLHLEPRQLPALYPGPRTYCQAHYLIARADPQAVGLPAELDMVDQTLRVEGTFRRPAGATPERFTIATAVANGKLFDLASRPSSGGSLRIDTASESATVIVRRNLDTLFDRVDFASMNERRMAREMLQNLIDGTEVEVRAVREED